VNVGTSDHPESAAASSLLERHYQVREIAEAWNISADTVRRIFRDEPDIIVIGSPSRLLGGRSKKYRRRYTMFRIPESVLKRVHARLMARPAVRSIQIGRNQ
jgi:hypothetical protein